MSSSSQFPHVFRREQLKRNAARRLRANATEAERKLWSLLRRKRIAGLRFRRQHPVGPYIADFYCAAAKLIIELDGSQHCEPSNLAYDAARTKWLERHGYCVLRFNNIGFLTE